MMKRFVQMCLAGLIKQSTTAPSTLIHTTVTDPAMILGMAVWHAVIRIILDVQRIPPPSVFIQILFATIILTVTMLRMNTFI